MIAVLQRVSRGQVSVDGQVVGQIGSGLVILLGVFRDDEPTDAEFLAQKIAGFRIFNDREGKLNLSLQEVQGAALVISQFTLCGDWRKGRRPSFVQAAPPEQGEKLYLDFIRRLRQQDIPVEAGRFGAMMEVSLVNQGPVTFVLDSGADRR